MRHPDWEDLRLSPQINWSLGVFTTNLLSSVLTLLFIYAVSTTNLRNNFIESCKMGLDFTMRNMGEFLPNWISRQFGASGQRWPERHVSEQSQSVWTVLHRGNGPISSACQANRRQITLLYSAIKLIAVIYTNAKNNTLGLVTHMEQIQQSCSSMRNKTPHPFTVELT